MSFIVSSITPFPNIVWWAQAAAAQAVHFDAAEHFEKMSYRNKYFIAGANGGIQLSIPLENGREQRAAMAQVTIHNKERWQIRQWRTLVSVYKRSPYFEHYEPELQSLFEQPFDKLVDFNLASIHWLKKQLRLSFEEVTLDSFEKTHTGALVDTRKLKPGAEKKAITGSEPYYQMFSDRHGFIPNLSMLDLLFSEGPHALQWLKDNKSVIDSWVGN